MEAAMYLIGNDKYTLRPSQVCAQDLAGLPERTPILLHHACCEPCLVLFLGVCSIPSEPGFSPRFAVLDHRYDGEMEAALRFMGDSGLVPYRHEDGRITGWNSSNWVELPGCSLTEKSK